MSPLTADFAVIGGGVIGLNLALEAKRRYPSAKVILLEKEKDCGFHASSRNSGVLHAGFYYTADSLKAQFCRDGNRLLKEYCAEKNIPVNICGKLVVTKDESELPGLEELYQRGRINKVPLEKINAQEAEEIEPRVLTHQSALFSPSTASVNPKQVIAALIKDAVSEGIEIHTDTPYLAKTADGLKSKKQTFSIGYIINAAGLYADKIALDYGFSQDYRILPFKGVYLYGDPSVERLRTNIYPVPNLNNPFLGVHFTLTAEGKVKIGPTAIPAFWREHYQGLERFNLEESIEILGREARLFFLNRFGFRKLALQEMQKYFRPKLVGLAKSMIKDLNKNHYRVWGQPGIRAQLFNIKSDKLEMDFKFEGDEKSFHVLNAVSPAFTCSIPFSKYLFDKIEQLNGKRPEGVKIGNN